MDIYHKAASGIVKAALKTGSAIALENLKEIRGKLNYSKEINGRLHSWSFEKSQRY